MPKPYNPVHHIIFKDDIDGITSAAIFLHNHVAGEAYRLYPMRYMKKEVFDDVVSSMKIREGHDKLIILNFINHKDSDLWISNKFDSSIGDRPVSTRKILYNPEEGCITKMVQSIPPSRPSTKYSDSFVSVVETITKEWYRSIYQIFNDTHPIMLIRAFLDRNKRDENMICRLVEMLRTTHMDFGKSAFQIKIGPSYLRVLKDDAMSISKSMMVTSNCSTVYQKRATQYPRYSEFLVNKNLKYSISVTRTPFQLDRHCSNK